MKAIVCGGRDFKPQDRHWRWLESQVHDWGVSHLISGGAPGADAMAPQFCRNRHMAFTVVPAKWKEFGKSAGPIRNGEMAEMASLVFAFPGGTGTQNMIDQALKKGLTVVEYDPHVTIISEQR